MTIALLEESAITTGDVAQFRSLFGVNPTTPVSLVTDTGFGGNCKTPAKLKANGEEGEAILDIEWAGAVAPGANLLSVDGGIQRAAHRDAEMRPRGNADLRIGFRGPREHSVC